MVSYGKRECMYACLLNYLLSYRLIYLVLRVLYMGVSLNRRGSLLSEPQNKVPLIFGDPHLGLEVEGSGLFCGVSVG